tara:strand:+ start:3915 stop:4544 length:630 start_codon:yes stop_codon:yes gene_type:complete
MEFLFAAGLIDSKTAPTAPLDDLPFAEAAVAAQEEFERMTNRTFIGVAATTQAYDHPVHDDQTHKGTILDLETEWNAVTSITRLGVTLTVTTDYILEPSNGPPYTFVRFLTRRPSPTPWSLIDEIIVTGTRGFGAAATLPDAVYLAALQRAAAIVTMQIGAYESGGATKQSQADVTEDWGGTPMKGFVDQWNAHFREVVNSYRRWAWFA